MVKVRTRKELEQALKAGETDIQITDEELWVACYYTARVKNGYESFFSLTGKKYTTDKDGNVHDSKFAGEFFGLTFSAMHIVYLSIAILLTIIILFALYKDYIIIIEHEPYTRKDGTKGVKTKMKFTHNKSKINHILYPAY